MEPEIGFEDALHELEGAVADLERGDLGLDDALARYERGMKLLTRCRVLLEGAERKVALLTGVDGAGEPTTAPFDASATMPPEPTGENRPTARSRSPRRAADPPRSDPEDAPF